MGCLNSKRSVGSDPEETNGGPQYPDLSAPNRVSDPGESITGVRYPDLSAPKVKGPRDQPEASKVPSSMRARKEPPAIPRPATRPHGARDSQQRRQRNQSSNTPMERDDNEVRRYTKPDESVATVRSKAAQDQDQDQDQDLPKQSLSRKPYQAYVEDVDEEEDVEEEEL